MKSPEPHERWTGAQAFSRYGYLSSLVNQYVGVDQWDNVCSNCGWSLRGRAILGGSMEVAVPTRTAVVLVHGWAGSAESWGPVAQLLKAEHGYSVHSMRLPGSPGGAGGPATIPAGRDSLIALLRTLERPAVLVGHSLGAQVTLRAHAAAPSLVHSEIVIDPAYGAAGAGP